MLRLKLLLASLFATISLSGVLADINVHGLVSDEFSNPQEGVNILITAFYADSTAYFESVLTEQDGQYSATIPAPPLNLVGIIDVQMVDCWGTVVTQEFTVFSNITEITANFVYCENFVIDSCDVTILEQWLPGALPSLYAWTPANVPVDYAWSTGETTQEIIPTSSGQYCVTVTFPWGCQDSACYDFTLDSSSFCFAYILTEINNDGSYNLTAVSYGTPPFTYLWSTGEVSESISNVGQGTYCVTVTDGTGCSYNSCVFLDDFNFCEVWIYEDPATGGLVAQGYGEEPISYIWNTGVSGPIIYPNGVEGYYCVTATDANQCIAESCYYYGNYWDSCYVFVSPVYTDSNTIGLQAIYSTFAQSWMFEWSTGETTEIIYPEDPTLTYCVTVTDSDGCVATGCFEPVNFCYAWVDVVYVDTTTAVLSVYSDPIFNWSNSNNASFVWSTGDTSAVITVTESGTYCVTATLGPDCVTEACVYVDFDALQWDCSAWIFQYPDSNGNWVAEATAWGFGEFSYEWSTGDTTSVIQLSSPTQFVCVTVTSTFGCVTEACVDTFFNPCKAYISVNYIGQGVAVLEAFGWNNPGQAGQYLWSTGDTGPILTVNVEGTYCVTVTGGGCVSEACVDVYFWNSDSCGVWINEEVDPLGVLYTAEAWGTAPFTYLWSNGWTEQSQIIDFGPTELCVTVTDAVGCVSVGCNYDPNGGNPNNDIIGIIFADTVVYGRVSAYAINPNGIFELIDSTQIEHNLYKFQGLPSGVYVIKAELSPNSPGYDDYIPTYHVSSVSWETADPIVLPNLLTVTMDIWMLRQDTMGGPGVIGGIITDPQNITAGADVEFRDGTGLPGVTVLLRDVQGNPLTYTTSLADGSFRFTDLPLGTYRISYDIPGLHSPDVWVTLTQDNPEKLQVSLVVEGEATSTDEPEAIQLEFYPNPAKENITVKIPGDHSSYHIQIVDMQGRIVETGSVKSKDGIMLIDVGQYSPGLYHINLQGENSSYFGRFVKQE